MYDPRNILRQAPESLRDWVLTIMAMLVVLEVIHLSGEATAIIGLVVYKTLTLFYVTPTQKAKVQSDLTALSEMSSTDAVMNPRPAPDKPPAKRA